jgi:acyl-CoA reductase-like NAD-dependent aldehyde dehydrogenase
MTTLPITTEAIDAAIGDLREGAETWGRLPLAERRQLLAAAVAATQRVASRWAETAAAIKQLPPDSPLVGEEWLSGPYPVLTSLHALSATLQALDEGRSPVDDHDVWVAPGGRLAVEVLPHGLFDKLLLNGFSARVWTTPGVSHAQLRDGAGLGQRTPEQVGGVTAVMGAGNISSIAPLDVLYELFAHNRVVLLKLNPIMDPLLEVYEAALAPFVERGLVRIVTGDGTVGQAIVDHPGVDHVHVTGSAATHDTIVFGRGEEGAARRAAGTPTLDKTITSELGGVSPTIVVPGDWAASDLHFQAEHVVTQKLHNSGFNCVASQVVVISSDWPQRDAFLEALGDAFAAAPGRPAYYPGADDRVEAMRAAYPDATHVGGGRLLLTGLDAHDDETALQQECFSPVLGVLELPGTGEEFLAAAVEAANEQFHGTLGANLIAAPATIDELGDAFEDAVAALRYGTIGVNAWTGVGFLTARARWGAFPGHTLDDVQSGIGVVHNALLLDHTERTVVTGPFRPFPRSIVAGELSLTPRPPWFVTNRTAHETGRRLTEFAGAPSWGALPGIFASALRG